MNFIVKAVTVFFSFIADILQGKQSSVDIVTSVKLNSPLNYRAIALSFDDGPDWGEENLVLALDSMGMQATFFWTWEKIHLLRKQNAGRFARLLNLIAAGGHEIGIHGISCETPPHLTEKLKDAVSEYEDLCLVRDNFSELLKQNISLYRPHNFQRSSGVVQELKTSGLKLVLGSPRYQIGQNNPDASLLKAFSRAKPGSIICCHDSKDCDPDFGLCEQITQLIPKLTKIVQKRKLGVLTISDIIRWSTKKRRIKLFPHAAPQ